MYRQLWGIGHVIWIFSQSVTGVTASANLYSLIATARANNLDPYVHLHRVFAELPRATTVEQIEALLPDKIKDGD